MSLFHDDENGPQEPIPGLPENLPEGETILWQGKPSTMAMVFGTFRMRWVIGWFVIVTLFRLANTSANGGTAAEFNSILLSSVLLGVGAIGLILLLAWAMARGAIFTITNHRVVMRYGFAIRKYINAPYAQMVAADLKRRSPRVGDIALQLDPNTRIGYLHLWPFARPFQYMKPQPMLRGIPEAEVVAGILANAVKARAPDTVHIATAQPEPTRHDADAPIGAAHA